MEIDTNNRPANRINPEDIAFPPIDFSSFDNVRIARDEDFRSVILQAAQNSECEFLFEIPAEMIGSNRKKAAAMRFFIENEPAYCFVVGKKTGSIEFLQEHEVSAAVSDFVHSYAQVLNLLAGEYPESEHIH